MKDKLLPILLIAFVACTPKPPETPPVEVIEIEYSLPYKFSNEIEAKLASDTMEWRFQEAASDYASKGDYQNALLQWDLGQAPREMSLSQEETDSINQSFDQVNAKDFILEAASDHRLVIINEAHHNSKHRFFTRSLLKGLYDQGYRYLGLEALSNGKFMDSSLNARKYPTQGTGYYIKDPQFGNMVREAISIGYEVFPYEDTTNANGKFREIGQARQIADKMRAHPENKFLIHCGYAHAFEGDYPSWEKAMAGRLKEFIDVDPLTITQTAYMEKSKPALSSPLLKAVQPAYSTILVEKESGAALGYNRGPAYTDLAVFHPFTTYTDGRPDWLYTNGHQKVELTIPEHQLNYPLMILSINASEDLQRAVPLDIVEADSTDEKVLLALPTGDYSVVMADGENEVVFDLKVE